MDLGKKGIIFSLLAIGFSGLFILLFSSSLERPIDEDINIVNTRVHDLDNGIDGFYAYAAESLDTAGFAAIEALYGQINDSGDAEGALLGSGNFESTLISCLDDSTGCTNPKPLTSLLDGYKDLLVNATRMELDYTIDNLTVTDEQHWLIEVTATISVNVTDEYARWRLNKTIKKTISTIGAHDPSYLVIDQRFGGTEERRIIPNERQDYVEWTSPAYFAEFLTGQEYHPSLRGPCLSDRFEGGFGESSDDCGLESVVDPTLHPTLLGAAYDQYVHMDYQVLTDQTYPACDELAGEMPRVSILAIEKMLTLTRQDATRYGLNNNSIWYYVPAIASTTARGCPYFV